MFYCHFMKGEYIFDLQFASLDFKIAHPNIVYFERKNSSFTEASFFFF